MSNEKKQRSVGTKMLVNAGVPASLDLMLHPAKEVAMELSMQPFMSGHPHQHRAIFGKALAPLTMSLSGYVGAAAANEFLRKKYEKKIKGSKSDKEQLKNLRHLEALTNASTGAAGGFSLGATLGTVLSNHNFNTAVLEANTSQPALKGLTAAGKAKGFGNINAFIHDIRLNKMLRTSVKGGLLGAAALSIPAYYYGKSRNKQDLLKNFKEDSKIYGSYYPNQSLPESFKKASESTALGPPHVIPEKADYSAFRAGKAKAKRFIKNVSAKADYYTWPIRNKAQRYAQYLPPPKDILKATKKYSPIALPIGAIGYVALKERDDYK